MQAHDKLDDLVAFVETARSLPMSSSVVINRNELLDRLGKLRDVLPADLKEAERVLSRREQMMSDAANTAERLLTAAAEEKQRLVSDEEVVRAARIEAGAMIQLAREQSDQMSRQVDGYVDAKLAHLEVSVNNIVEAIRRGRTHLSEAAGLYAELAADTPALDADLPELAGPPSENYALASVPAPEQLPAVLEAAEAAAGDLPDDSADNDERVAAPDWPRQGVV